MREIGTSGSVRGGGGNAPTYSASSTGRWCGSAVASADERRFRDDERGVGGAGREHRRLLTLADSGDVVQMSAVAWPFAGISHVTSAEPSRIDAMSDDRACVNQGFVVSIRIGGIATDGRKHRWQASV